MNAGKLDKKIIIQQKTYTVNSIGERVVSLSTYKTVYGKVEWATSKRLLEANKDSLMVFVKAIIRYIPDFSTDYMCSIDGTSFEIVSYIEVDRKAYLELMLIAKRNDG
jgi:SPP1 family predicted phage head-tail adaptor